MDKKNYLKNTKELIDNLEHPLAELEDILTQLKELDISESKQEEIIKKLKFLGEIFEPRKGKFKTN